MTKRCNNVHAIMSKKDIMIPVCYHKKLLHCFQLQGNLLLFFAAEVLVQHTAVGNIQMTFSKISINYLVCQPHFLLVHNLTLSFCSNSALSKSRREEKELVYAET